MTQSYSRMRKIYYLAGIIVLLGIAYVHKYVIIDEAAVKYDMSETNLGKVDLGGSISRFTLSSFRGPLVCGLWWEVDKLQQRHDYKQLETILTALTKLQPHYKGPWKYQGWNLAYNVSVEFDRVNDKYLYISKGIRWLAKGEEINRVKLFDTTGSGSIRTIGDPEMRSEIAQYIANKMYYADEQLIFRPLLHMSCIPQTQRDPVALNNNPSQLARFKQQYPRFVRRVRTYLNIPDGDTNALNRALISFLAEHQDLPSLWNNDIKETVTLSNDPWPRWPDMSSNNELLGKVADKEILQDGLDIATHWYTFSTEMLPAPKTNLAEDITPEQDKYTRTNKNMHSIIFRAKPAQTQSRSAQELYKEGWNDQARTIADYAYNEWIKFGVACNIAHTDETIAKQLKKAQQYAEKYKDKADLSAPPPDYLKDQNLAEYNTAMENYKAYIFSGNLNKLRTLCRYDYWVGYNQAAKTSTYSDAMRSKYIAEIRYSDWPVSINHYNRCIGDLQEVLHEQMSMPSQISLRTSLLLPNYGTLFQQFIPTMSDTLTTYGSNETTHEELIELQDKFMRTKARELAPNRLRAELLTWQLRQYLTASMQAGSPLNAFSIAQTPIMNSNSMINIDLIEDIVENSKGPFENIVAATLKEGREKDRSASRK